MMSKNISFLWSVLTDTPKPDVVSINLTPYCNQRCKYCEIGNGKVKPTKPLLTFDDLKWIIDQMQETGIPLISIGGGEPLTVPWLWDVIRYAHEKGINTEIITNGMLIPTLDGDKRSCLKLTSNVSVSIDAYDPEIQDYLRGVPGAFWKQRCGVEILQKNKIPYSIATVLSGYNHSKISELVRIMDTHGARFVKFQPVWQGSNFPEVDGIDKKPLGVQAGHIPVLLSELQSITEFEKVSDVKTNAGELLDWIESYLSEVRSEPVYKNYVNKYRCHTIHSIITINYYGEILPCNYQKPEGNINSRENITSLWNTACNETRKTFKKDWYMPECFGCTCSLEMGIICSGIRYPIKNRSVLPKIAGMVRNKLEKRKALQ